MTAQHSPQHRLWHGHRNVFDPIKQKKKTKIKKTGSHACAEWIVAWILELLLVEPETAVPAVAPSTGTTNIRNTFYKSTSSPRELQCKAPKVCRLVYRKVCPTATTATATATAACQIQRKKVLRSNDKINVIAERGAAFAEQQKLLLQHQQKTEKMRWEKGRVNVCSRL